MCDVFGIERWLDADDFSAQAANDAGLESIAFELHDEWNDVRLLFEDGRNQLGVELVGAGSDERSNRLEIPVFTTEGVDPTGIVIRAVNVPVHSTTGAV